MCKFKLYVFVYLAVLCRLVDSLGIVAGVRTLTGSSAPWAGSGQLGARCGVDLCHWVNPWGCLGFMAGWDVWINKIINQLLSLSLLYIDSFQLQAQARYVMQQSALTLCSTSVHLVCRPLPSRTGELHVWEWHQRPDNKEVMHASAKSPV